MNLPNKLTLFRICLIPIFIIVLVMSNPLDTTVILGTPVPRAWIIADFIFFIASFTDYLDGQIARKHHLITNFGKFADPLADKMLVMTAFIFLVSFELAPAWVIAIIICRELAVTGLRLLLVGDGEVMAAAWPGKVKTVTQMLSIIFLLLNNALFNDLGFPLGSILLYVCLFFTIYSGFDYFYKNRQIFNETN